MRLQGRTFIPGFRVEENNDEEEFDEQQIVVAPHMNGGINGHHNDRGDIVAPRPAAVNGERLAVNEPTEQTAVRGVRTTNGDVNSETDSSDEEDSEDERSESSDYETECYEAYTRFRNAKKKEAQIPLEGVDWESVNYELNKFKCDEDEITGLDVSDSYIAVQYYIESAIDVYDRKSFKHLFRLDGHEYGGQCLKISDCSISSLKNAGDGGEAEKHPTDANVTRANKNNKSLLYSASMDCSLKSWNLKKQCMVDSVTDHCDYIESLTIHQTENADFIATGGRGDKAIFVYKASNEGKFNRLFKLQGHTGWVIQTIFIDCSNPDSCQESNKTNESNQQCPNFLLSASEDGTIKLWDLTNKGAIVLNLEQCAGISCMIASKLKGSPNTLIVFGDKEGKMSYLDLGTPDQLRNYAKHPISGGSSGCSNGINGYSDDDDDEPTAIHLLPNILIGTGKYCRSSKYHDKAVDTAYLTDNGYLITASAGSKYVKIWKINVSALNSTDGKNLSPAENSTNSEHSSDDKQITYDLEKTDVRELQILRDYSDYLSIFRVFGGSIYSSCSDGHIYNHAFPELNNDTVHYDMAYDEEEAKASATTTVMKKGFSFGNSEDDDLPSQQETQLLSSPENCTEICDGPRLCRTGKTGLVRSSSSFQVSFQLKPSVSESCLKIKLPAANKPAAIQEEDEWSADSDSDVDDSDEYEIEYVSDEESDDSA